MNKTENGTKGTEETLQQNLFLMRQLGFIVQKKREGEINEMSAFCSVQMTATAGILCSKRASGRYVHMPS
jgi:hypothetical protein